MKLRLSFKLIIMLFFSLLVFAGVGFYFYSPCIINCFLISMSGNFTETEHNIYISNDTPERIKDSVISVIKNADKRVCGFWNAKKKSGDPVIIFCYSNSLLKDYSNGNFILTYKTPLNSFVVFHKDRIDIDMVSHELFHTEFCARVGYFKNIKLPVWFDEGLAMQVDYRDEYSEEKYIQLKDSLHETVNFFDISTPEGFYKNNFYYHFVLAKHEVSLWLNAVQKDGFDRFIRRINGGEDFYKVYKN